MKLGAVKTYRHKQSKITGPEGMISPLQIEMPFKVMSVNS